MAPKIVLWGINPWSCLLEIVYLQSPFNQNYYDYAFIGDSRVTSGSSSYSGYMLGLEYAPPSGSYRGVTIYCDVPKQYQGTSKRVYGGVAVASDGRFYPAGNILLTVPRPATREPTQVNLSVTTKDYSANLSWTGGTYAYYYEIYLDGSLIGVTTSKSYVVEGLWPDEEFEFGVAAVNDYGYLYDYVIARTKPPLPYPPDYISASIINLNTLRVNFIKDSEAYYTELYWNTSGNDPAYGSAYDARTTGSSTISVSGLPYETPIYFWLRSRTSGGVIGEWMYCDCLTTGVTPPPTPPVIDTRHCDGSVTLIWGSIVGATYYTLNYRKSGSSSWSIISNLTVTVYKLEGLEFGTRYDFRVKSDMTTEYSSINVGTTLPETPILTKSTITYDSIRLRIGPLSGGCDRISVECYYEGLSVYVETKIIDPPGRTSTSYSYVTFSGLNRNWSYEFMAVAYYDAGGDGTGTGLWLPSCTSNHIVLRTLNRPDNWSWSYSIVSGGPVYNTYYNPSSGILTAYIMTAQEWNNFTYRINDFRQYLGLNSYRFTQVSSGSGCTPAIINQAINAINDMLSTGKMSLVGPGPVPASIFNTMRTKLNSL